MTKKKAVDILIALACCTIGKLPCDMCPLVDDGCKWSDKDVVEAVNVLKGTSMKIIKNPDAAVYEEMTEAVKANDGYCPCAIVKTEDTKCPCREFREQETAGECHCGRFVKVEEQEADNEQR